MVKMLALDMDGTLLSSKRCISPANKKAIQELCAEGVHVVLCTGRGRYSMLDAVRELELFQTRHIANMGALFVEGNGDSYVRHSFSRTQLEKLILPLNAMGLAPMVTCKDKIVYETLTDELVEDYSWSNKDVPIVKGDLLSCENAFKVTVFSYDLDLIKQAGGLCFDDVHTYVSDVYFVDYIPYGTDKLSALRELARDHGIAMQDIIAIGDSSLDREMLTGCGFGIAVANSDEELKAVADRICDYTNDEDAVARAIYKYIFQRPYAI